MLVDSGLPAELTSYGYPAVCSPPCYREATMFEDVNSLILEDDGDVDKNK